MPKRYFDIDVVLLHLAGTTVKGIMLTTDGKEVLKCIIQRRLFQSIIMTMMFSNQHLRTSKEGGHEDQIHYLMHGETYNFEVSRQKQQEG